MAVGLRGLSRLNLSLANTVFSKSNFINAGIRFMYTDKDLGISSYENIRFVYRNQFVSIEDTFRSKMQEICQKEDGVIFTEDLKAMIHLAQPTETDMQLISDMLLKFVKFKSDKQFATYVFGTVIMRMCYYFNEPKLALSMFNNPDLGDTFMYHSAIKIFMSLLYKHQMYDEVKEVFEKLKSMGHSELSALNSILVFAACLKQNTPESAEFALSQWKEITKIRSNSLRSTAIVAYLAIKHNAAEDALELISTISRENSMAVRCLKVMAYTHLGKYLSIIPILKNSVEHDVLMPHRFGFYADVIYELQEKVQNETGMERDQILPLIEKLRQQQRIETDKTFEEFLLRPLISLRNAQREQHASSSKRQSDSRVGLKSYL